MSMSKMPALFGCALLACALAPCAHAAAASDPPSGWFGNVYLGGARSFDASKVFVVSFRVTEGAAELVDAAVAYGTESRLPAASSDYVVELTDARDHVLASQQAADPRRIVVEKEGNAMLSSALLSVRLSFDRAATRVTLKDRGGRVIAQSDVASAIAVFCRRNQNDPDCR